MGIAFQLIFLFSHFKYEWTTKDYQASEGSLNMKDKNKMNRKKLKTWRKHRPCIGKESKLSPVTSEKLREAIATKK